jgi:hypothetical protein
VKRRSINCGAINHIVRHAINDPDAELVVAHFLQLRTFRPLSDRREVVACDLVNLEKAAGGEFKAMPCSLPASVTHRQYDRRTGILRSGLEPHPQHHFKRTSPIHFNRLSDVSHRVLVGIQILTDEAALFYLAGPLGGIFDLRPLVTVVVEVIVKQWFSRGRAERETEDQYRDRNACRHKFLRSVAV